jgi:LysM repeat protein
MKKKRNWFARFLALVALVAAVIAVIVVASNTHLHSSSDKGGNAGSGHAQQQNKKQPEKKKARTKAKTYEVQSGDTLTSIAQATGLTVSELQALNPEIDPQTLIAGEVLQLQK